MKPPPKHERDAKNAPPTATASGAVDLATSSPEVRDGGVPASVAMTVLPIGQGHRRDFATAIAGLIRETGGGACDLVLIAVPPGGGRPLAEDLAASFSASGGTVEDKREDKPTTPEDLDAATAGLGLQDDPDA